jgi:CheY-like chemotaxis protein
MQMNATKHIFYVDDDPDDLELLEAALQDIRVTVRLTTLRESSLLFETMDATGMPDLIILDINMPVKTGIECMRELQQKQEYKHIPIVIYSTTSSSAFAPDDTGVALFVQKGDSMAQVRKFATEVCDLLVKNTYATA